MLLPVGSDTGPRPPWSPSLLMTMQVFILFIDSVQPQVSMQELIFFACLYIYQLFIKTALPSCVKFPGVTRRRLRRNQWYFVALVAHRIQINTSKCSINFPFVAERSGSSWRRSASVAMEMLGLMLAKHPPLDMALVRVCAPPRDCSCYR